MQRELKVELGFVQRRLPWLIAAMALVVYLLTLNHSSTFAGVSSLAKAAGWDWRSNVVAPLHVLVTFPIRWLPVGLQLFALNLLAALAAALALGLLGRAVALLPHDRTREQRALERSDHSLLSIPAAWLPPVLAALVCGLQLTFWENAVVATGEAFDLLIFAWLVNCLLDYRLDEKASRLKWFALVYGLAVTNNYAMVCFFPAFLIALVWIKGMTFFRLRFLLTMCLWGMAGLCLYLLLPLVESATDLAGFTFWELLRSYWGYQKSMVLGLQRYIIVLCSLTSLVPVLFMGIRWPAQFGEASAAGNALTNLMTHIIHAVFLLACLYVAFDPPFSPRSLTSERYAMLPIYLLGALAIGYCSGYFLLVFGAKHGPQAWQRPSPLRHVINLGVLYTIRLAVLAVPVGLLIQNFPVIWASSGKAMNRLAQEVAKALPPQGAYVLSDDAFRLNALQYELLKTQPDHKHVLIDTTQLIAAGYHSYLQKRYRKQWPEFQRPEDPKALIDSVTLITLVEQLTRLGRVYYLHPSFGYYFEAFYARTSGPVYELKRYEDAMRVAPPALTPEEVAREDQFWASLKATELDPLIKNARPFRKPSKRKIQPKTLQSYLAEIYSRALTEVGVQIQRAGDFVRAARLFEWATQLNPSNPSALLNLEYNRQHQTGKGQQSYQLSDAARQRLEIYGGRWDWILGHNGPVDEPAACLYLAESFERGRNFRQAAQNLERTLFFDPEQRGARLKFMMMCVKASLPQLALRYLHDFRKRYPDTTLKEAELLDLITIEAWARVTADDLGGAEQLLAAAQQRYPQAASPWDTLSDIYLSREDATNAIKVLERQLQVQPSSVRALANYGGMLLRLNRAAEALPHLDKALRIDPKDEPSLINRAQVNLSLDRLDDALRDFQALLSAGTIAYELHALFHSADIYFRKGNKKGAIDYYERFLKAAPEGLGESVLARARLKQLKSGSL